MIDHLVGRPNPSWKRTQVFLVILFWLWRILRGNPGGPRMLWLRRANRVLKRFTPWQLIVSTLTGVYAVRNLDKILGLGSPEPLAHLYSPSYYRATWINIGLEAGFATAMSIRPKWLRDLCSVLFSVYYIVYAHEADEKLRKFRAVPTVEMLRTTWEKTTNPYIRLVTHLPRVSIRRKILLPRPRSSTYQRPITAYLFFAPHENQLCQATDLILDFPGGGFIAMTPEHHEERLRTWAVDTGKPVLSIDYGKAPEYPYPFAIDEAFDTYKALVESTGILVGMSGKRLNIILTGDSAGATIAINVMIKILEHNTHSSRHLPKPLALVFNYAALDFNFTSWMSPINLRVLRSEQSSGNLPGMKELVAQKDHLQHVSPLSMVGDRRPRRHGKSLKRQTSWRDTLRGLTTSGNEDDDAASRPTPKTRHSTTVIRTPSTRMAYSEKRRRSLSGLVRDDEGVLADSESEDDKEDYQQWKEEDRPIQARVRFVYPHTESPPSFPRTDSAVERQQEELFIAIAKADTKAGLAPGGKGSGKEKEKEKGKTKEPIGTKLTMTSRAGYFQDRIVSPSMMRAMAILYLGPHRNPDFATDYHISPILTPDRLLAQFPPLLMQCGEKDPFVDDTVIFAGRVREAKRARKVELDLIISGKSARFGESLRMSATSPSNEPIDGSRLASMKKERDQLAKETDDDWVQVVIFSDWSHGYLQMPTLMPEAQAVIEELAVWIDDAFRTFSMSPQNGFATKAIPVPSSPFASETETDDTITFVPKKYQGHLRRVSEALEGVGGMAATESVNASSLHTDSSGSGTLREDADKNNLVDASRDALRAPIDNKYELSPSPPFDANQTGSPGKHARQTGQTISETELMRRRRLLDSHIFEN